MCNWCGIKHAEFKVFTQVLLQDIRPDTRLANSITVRLPFDGGRTAADGLFEEIPCPPDGVTIAWVRDVLLDFFDFPCDASVCFLQGTRLLRSSDQIPSDNANTGVATLDLIRSYAQNREVRDAEFPEQSLLCAECYVVYKTVHYRIIILEVFTLRNNKVG